MIWLSQNWRLVIGCVLAGLLCTISAYGGYFYEHAKWNEEKLRVQEDALTAMETHAEMIRKADEQHDKDNITIVSLHTDVERLRNTVHLPTCPKDSDEAGRVFSASVDRLFGKFQERVGGLIQECDTINSDAIRSNSITY